MPARSQPPDAGSNANPAEPSTGANAPPPTQALLNLGPKFWLGVLAASCVIAALAGRASRTPPTTRPVTEAPLPLVAQRQSATTSSAVVTPAPALAVRTEEPAATAERAQSAPQRAMSPCDTRAHEQEINAAHARLARGEFAAVIAATDRDRDRCPRGSMSEDRERLAIEALVRSGQRARADARWRTFQRRFPHSLYARALGVLLDQR
ncbi:MAG: hypothetical protein U0269_06740 [Polyangiales bacterium]